LVATRPPSAALLVGADADSDEAESDDEGLCDAPVAPLDADPDAELLTVAVLVAALLAPPVVAVPSAADVPCEAHAAADNASTPVTSNARPAPRERCVFLNIVHPMKSNPVVSAPDPRAMQD
jgi:hypothetical protein